jgi:hypothetical protein
MDTVGTGRASQLRLPERQFGWRPPHPRRRRRPSISGTRFIASARIYLSIYLSIHEGPRFKKLRGSEAQIFGGSILAIYMMGGS